MLRENAKQQEITSTQAEATMATAREKLEIQKTQNESDIAAANLRSELAQLDLVKFQDGEFPQQEQQLKGDVAIAKEELIRSKDTMQFTSGQVKKGYASQNDLDASRVAVQQAELKLRGAEELLNVLQNFTYKRTIAELKANAAETEREMARVRLKANSAKTQCEKESEAARLTYDVEREKLVRLQNQIDACTLRATQDGEVVYASMSSSGGSRSSQPIVIEAGATVRERQAIINLPDVTQMKVDCRIHESLIGAIRKGLRARIRVDAYPDEIYNGEIAHVSSVPMSGSWPNTDLREYQTEVKLTDEIDKVRKLRPGLTSQVEILVDNRPNVLQVPIQSVLTVADKQIVFVFNGNAHERRFVKIGVANQSHIEIVEGVKEGERVVMNPRSQYGTEIVALEAELNASNSKAQAKADAAAPTGPAGTLPIPGVTPPVVPGSPPGAGGPGPGGPGKPGGPSGGPGGGGGGNFFARLDKNGDGQISADEAPDQMKSRFAELDKNGDGKLSRDEMPAGRPPQ
ncbi:HlyD family secretion protein [Planctomicrobium piriforme]|uniref:HlyD family secretion protein n=1 Tax=Planctomicrobium piriforme TaxID=1576369 RepID=A0A1I3F2A5_9PLAN|nr:HlyD family secretion protein [Planctomicrobium piriforme]